MAVWDGFTRCSNKDCQRDTDTVVRCELCFDAFCCECGEHMPECDGCGKRICQKCVATHSQADYIICRDCLEKMIVTSDDMEDIKSTISQAIQLSDQLQNAQENGPVESLAQMESFAQLAQHNFDRRLALAGQIGRVRGVLLGLAYRYGF